MKIHIIPLSFAFLLVLVSSCSKNSTVENSSLTKEIDISSFTIRTPDNWDWQEDQGIDTFIGRITNSIDTIYFDMGYLSFGGLENVKENDRTISIESLKINGVSSIIVKERTAEDDFSGEIRLSAYIDAGDKIKLNRLYIFDPQDEDLILSIFKSHKFQ